MEMNIYNHNKHLHYWPYENGNAIAETAEDDRG